MIPHSNMTNTARSLAGATPASKHSTTSESTIHVGGAFSHSSVDETLNKKSALLFPLCPSDNQAKAKLQPSQVESLQNVPSTLIAKNVEDLFSDKSIPEIALHMDQSPGNSAASTLLNSSDTSLQSMMERLKALSTKNTVDSTTVSTTTTVSLSNGEGRCEATVGERLDHTLLNNRLNRLKGTDNTLLNQLIEVQTKAEAFVESKQLPKGIVRAEVQAIIGYTQSGYLKLNPALRDNLVVDLNTYDTYIDAIVSGLNKLPVYQETVFRGTDLSDNQLAQYQEGATVLEKGFTSTTTSKAEADGSVNGGGFKGNVLFEIKSNTGRDISMVAHDPSEKEVLFAPNTEFIVNEVATKGQNGSMTIIRLTEKNN